MIRLALALLLMIATAGVAADQPPTDPGIPGELNLRFEYPKDPPEVPCQGPAEARLNAVSKVAFADAVDLIGHLERTDGRFLIVVGRQVDTEFATIRGGGRTDLQPGSLIRVEGNGEADGTVHADTITLQPARDPTTWSRLKPELEKFYEKYWKDAVRYQDPELEAYLERIAASLVPRFVPEVERSIKVIVVENPDLNAFALPDGTVVMHSGIIARMENEAQLASVLGHEIAHITQRHTLRAMTKETEHRILSFGSLLTAIALGASGNADAAKGVQMMSSAWLSGYSRAHEDEADLVGLRYLYLAGYDVAEAPNVWRTFQLLYGPESAAANFFYGSHSTGRDREYHLDHEIWKSYEPSDQLGGNVARTEFQRATANLVRVNALLDLKRGNLAWAAWGLAKSLSANPDDPDTHVALGQLALRRDGTAGLSQALASFAHAIELASSHAIAHRELGFALKRLDRREESRAAFARYLALAPDADDAAQIRREL